MQHYQHFNFLPPSSWLHIMMNLWMPGRFHEGLPDPISLVSPTRISASGQNLGHTGCRRGQPRKNWFLPWIRQDARGCKRIWIEDCLAFGHPEAWPTSIHMGFVMVLSEIGGRKPSGLCWCSLYNKKILWEYAPLSNTSIWFIYLNVSAVSCIFWSLVCIYVYIYVCIYICVFTYPCK